MYFGESILRGESCGFNFTKSELADSLAAMSQANLRVRYECNSRSAFPRHAIPRACFANEVILLVSTSI